MKFRFALLVPLFDNLNYPEYQSFNIRGKRSDKILFEIIEHVSKIVPIETRELFFFGYDEGGHFIQNFALAYPQRVARGAMQIAPSLTFPRKNKLFPYGLEVSPLAPDIKVDFYNFIKSDLLLIAGTTEASKVLQRFASELDILSIEKGVTPRLVFFSSIGRVELSQGLFETKEVRRFLFPDYVVEQ